MDELQTLADALTRESLIALMRLIGEPQSTEVDRAFEELADRVLSEDNTSPLADLPRVTDTAIGFNAEMQTLGTLLKLLPLSRRDQWLKVLGAEIAKFSRQGFSTKATLENVVRAHGSELPAFSAWVAQRYPKESIGDLYRGLADRDAAYIVEQDEKHDREIKGERA
jgi:hypothetical protein